MYPEETCNRLRQIKKSFPNLIPHKIQYINDYICTCLALFFILVFIRLPEYHILQFHAFFFVVSLRGTGGRKKHTDMGLLKKLFSDDAPKQWEVKIKGTVQRNGPIPVNRTFIVDDIRQAQAFQGANRYEVIAEWLRVNYPGATYDHIRHFAAEVKPVKK